MECVKQKSGQKKIRDEDGERGHDERHNRGVAHPRRTAFDPMRYYLNVRNQDYVFVWPGRSAVYCGK